MCELESVIHLDKTLIIKNYMDYKIKIKNNFNSITISIENYENNFQLEYFHNLEVVKSISKLDDLIDLIIKSIDNKEIKIEKNEINIFLIINKLNLKLTLNKKSEEKKYIQSINLIYKTTIYEHTANIWSMAVFPSGNFVSVGEDKSIIIFDNQYNIIQKIQNAHSEAINYVNIKDENNFITCSSDKNIITWKKKDNIFILNEKIINAHKDNICKVIYLQNEKIISCSFDYSVKIWELNNKNKYEFVIGLTHSNRIVSFLYLEDKKLLITSGDDETRFWNILNYECIKCLNEVECCSSDALRRIDDNIIVAYDGLIKVISINEKKVIKKIDNYLIVWCIYVLEEIGIFLTVGVGSKSIRIYNNENYQCIQTIKGTHNDDIIGIIYLNNNLIATYSFENNIKIWSISENKI